MKKEHVLCSEGSKINFLLLMSLLIGFNDLGKKNKITKRALKNCFVVCKNNNFSFYVRKIDYMTINEELLKSIIKNHKFYKKILVITERLSKEIIRILKKFTKTKLEKEKNEYLFTILEKCYNLSLEISRIDAILSIWNLDNKLEEIIKNKKITDKRKDIIDILIVSQKLSFLQKLKQELLKNKDNFEQEKVKALNIYPWVNKIEIGKNESDLNKTMILQRIFKKELAFNKVENGFFENEQYFSYQRILIEEMKMMLDYTINAVFRVIARNTFYATHQLNFATIEELKKIIRKKGINRNELLSRKRLCFIELNNKKLRIFLDKKAEKLIK